MMPVISIIVFSDGHERKGWYVEDPFNNKSHSLKFRETQTVDKSLFNLLNKTAKYRRKRIKRFFYK